MLGNCEGSWHFCKKSQHNYMPVHMQIFVDLIMILIRSLSDDEQVIPCEGNTVPLLQYPYWIFFIIFVIMKIINTNLTWITIIQLLFFLLFKSYSHKWICYYKISWKMYLLSCTMVHCRNVYFVHLEWKVLLDESSVLFLF